MNILDAFLAVISVVKDLLIAKLSIFCVGVVLSLFAIDYNKKKNCKRIVCLAIQVCVSIVKSFEHIHIASFFISCCVFVFISQANMMKDIWREHFSNQASLTLPVSSDLICMLLFVVCAVSHMF